MAMVVADIFKAYDIRGIVPLTLNSNAAYLIGRALGTVAHEKNISKVALGRDGRLSGPEMHGSLARGLLDSGVSVLDVGEVTTPMLYFAAYSFCNGSGIMVTGSHNPAEYNGFKMLLAGETLAGDAIQDLFVRIMHKNLVQDQEKALLDTRNVSATYINYVCNTIKLKRPLHIAVDCGNGIAGAFAGRLYREMGCQVVERFCQVDGHFPNHHPDPSKPENLQDLIKTVQDFRCDFGLAFDGDGDRIGVVTQDGKIIWPDRQLMLFAKDVLSRNPGATVVYDVKSTRNLAPWIEQHGGKPLMCRTGHSFIKAKMKETGALLAGEMSGHVFFKEKWFGFDDGLYAGARLLEILSGFDNPSGVLNKIPESVSTPEITIDMQVEGENHEFIKKLKQTASFMGATSIIDIDGLRVEYPNGFGLIRASNTTPSLVLRFEADTKMALDGIKKEFKNVLTVYKELRDIDFYF